MKVKKKVNNIYFLEGAHSNNSTGEPSDAEFPPHLHMSEWKTFSYEKATNYPTKTEIGIHS